MDKEALRELAEKATPGPWKAHVGEFEGRTYANVYPSQRTIGGAAIVGQKTNRTNSKTDKRVRDVEFVAAANPQTILSLLAEIQSLTEQRTAWRVTAENAEAELVNARKQMEAQKDEWLSWEAKRSDLERDAGRYRWLRLPDSDVPISTEAARDSVFYDAAIDYAMKEEK